MGITHNAVFGLVVLAVFLAPNTHANGQSKEETKAFITKKAKCTFSYNKKWTQHQSVSFKGNLLVMKQETKFHSDGLVTTETYSVQLKDLNPSRVKRLSDSGFGVPCLEFRPTKYGSMTKVYKNSLRTNSNRSKAFAAHMFAKSQRTSIQLQKALVHLIKISGGKGELFEE